MALDYDVLLRSSYSTCSLTCLGQILNMLYFLRAADDGPKLIVGIDHALVFLVLQAILLDVRPDFLGNLSAR